MRNILKPFLFSLISLFGTTKLIEGFSFSNDPVALAFAAVVFGVASSIIKPVLKLITLPLNLVTLGGFSLLLNAILLYSVIQIVPGLSAEAFLFPGFKISTQYLSLSVPSFDLPVLGTVFLASVAISFFMVSLGALFGN